MVIDIYHDYCKSLIYEKTPISDMKIQLKFYTCIISQKKPQVYYLSYLQLALGSHLSTDLVAALASLEMDDFAHV